MQRRDGFQLAPGEAVSIRSLPAAALAYEDRVAEGARATDVDDRPLEAGWTPRLLDAQVAQLNTLGVMSSWKP
jgi:hypothetical protein